MNKDNLEVVNCGGALFNIKEHLAINKVLKPINSKSKSTGMGFFKICNGELQIHFSVSNDGVNEWHRFNVLNANEQETQRNIKLNI